MTHKVANTSDNFTAFLSAAADRAACEVAQVRRQSTHDERTVLALEMIADQLALIHAHLSLIDGSAHSGSPAEIAAASSSVEADMQCWDNEGGNQNVATSMYPEIVRSIQHRFSVGGYHYTDLQNAISEAKRVRLAELSV